MTNPRDLDAFDVQFVIQEDKESDVWNRKLKFYGEIDLGPVEGKLTCLNSLLNWNEMKGKVYSQMFAKIEETLSFRAFGVPPIIDFYRKESND